MKKLKDIIEPPDTSKLKLDIGAGNNPRDNTFKTVDKFAKTADYKCDAWDIPLPDDSVDEIFSSHMLEHIEYNKVVDTLKEWLRIMKIGARGELWVPDMDYVAKYWLHGEDRYWAQAMVFGNQAHKGEFHKSGFTTGILKATMEELGYTVKRVEIIWSHSQDTIKVVFSKEEPVIKKEK